MPTLSHLIVLSIALGAACASPTLQTEPFKRYAPAHGSNGVGSVKALTPRYRLPNQIIPRHYVLHLRPKLLETGFEPMRVPGSVDITVECVSPTNVITLHADEMDIYSTITVSPESNPAHRLILKEVRRNSTNQILEIELEENLSTATKYVVHIDFKSRIDTSTRMNGLYLSTYLDDDGQKRLIATTQFSRTQSVRKVFPSFDEPNRKASFQINIGRTAEYHSLSCMDLDRTDPDEGLPGWFWDRYFTTPVMPITVIAFIVSDFANVTAPLDFYNPEKPVSTWVPPPMTRNDGAVFSAESAAKTLKYYEELFDIPYELPKLDSAGMPDFAAGAMENWGLNIYRTTYMLYYKGETPIATKYSSAAVIAHEVAHQWWGNLVTHAWWNDWWITEGFASYFEYTAANAVSPGFNPVDRIVCDDVQPAMAFDIGPTSVPIHGKDTETFVEIPSTINYSKGASLIRMMDGFLSTAVFIPALQYYLKKRSYTAVDQYALLDDVTEYLQANEQSPANGLAFREIMDSWTLQWIPAYSSLKGIQYSNLRISVRSEQERFEAYAGGNPSPSNELFHVPISFVTAADPKFETNGQPKLWINVRTVLHSHSVASTDQWMVCNVDARGYYRVLYDDHFAGLLIKQLTTDHNVISVASRSQILDDYFASSFERYIGIESALDLTTYLSSESTYVVWTTVLKHLRKYSNLVANSGPESLEAFQKYIQTSLKGALEYVGLEQAEDEEPHLTILRVLVMDWACAVQEPACLARAKELVTEWMNSPDVNVNPIPIDIQAITYCAAVGSEDDAIWTFINERYVATPTVELRNALACTGIQSRLDQLLLSTLSDKFPMADGLALIQRVGSTTAGRAAVISFLNIQTVPIIGHFESQTSVSNIISAMGNYIGNAEDRDKIQGIANKFDSELDEVRETIRSNLEGMDANAEWLSYFGVPMAAWIKTFVDSA